MRQDGNTTSNSAVALGTVSEPVDSGEGEAGEEEEDDNVCCDYRDLVVPSLTLVRRFSIVPVRVQGRVTQTQ